MLTLELKIPAKRDALAVATLRDKIGRAHV